MSYLFDPLAVNFELMFVLNAGARLQKIEKKMDEGRFATKGSTKRPRAERPDRTNNAYNSYHSFRKKFKIFYFSVAG